MEFDHHTLVMLMLRPDAPVQSPQSAQTLQDAHLAFIADQVAAGHILAAGPAPRIALATPWLEVARCSEGRMCQSPNSADEVSSTRHFVACRASMPHRTERKATSSSRIVLSGMMTNADIIAPGAPRW